MLCREIIATEHAEIRTAICNAFQNSSVLSEGVSANCGWLVAKNSENTGQKLTKIVRDLIFWKWCQDCPIHCRMPGTKVKVVDGDVWEWSPKFMVICCCNFRWTLICQWWKSCSHQPHQISVTHNHHYMLYLYPNILQKLVNRPLMWCNSELDIATLFWD